MELTENRAEKNATAKIRTGVITSPGNATAIVDGEGTNASGLACQDTLDETALNDARAPRANLVIT